MNGELLRIVDSIHRDKEIDKEIIFVGIEAALVSAAKKHLGRDDDDIVIIIDRETGAIDANDAGKPIDPVALGRIAAQAAKQVMIQKIREAERDVIFNDYETKKGTLVTGTVQRFEGPNIIVNLGRVEGHLPKSDQMPDDSYKTGERIRTFIFDVKKVGQRVKIILSRTHKDLVRRLFEVEVPEIGEQVIEIKALAREAGYRTKIAVESNDPRVDPVGACVGVRGSRIRNIVEELNGEKIDIIRWNDMNEILIANALKPAEVTSIELDPETLAATVVVDKEQLSLAIGRRGQNVRLAAKLSGWHIDIVTESEELQRTEVLVDNLAHIPDLEEGLAQKIADLGYASIDEILFRGTESLTEIEGIDEEKAAELITYISEHREIFVAPPKLERKSGGPGPKFDALAKAAEKLFAEENLDNALARELEEEHRLEPSSTDTENDREVAENETELEADVSAAENNRSESESEPDNTDEQGEEKPSETTEDAQEG